jgi:prophage regulatory protein
VAADFEVLEPDAKPCHPLTCRRSPTPHQIDVLAKMASDDLSKIDTDTFGDGTVSQMEPHQGHRAAHCLMSVKATCERATLSKATLYRLIAKELFPRPIPISDGRVAFVESEVQAWIDQKISNARGAKALPSGHQLKPLS